MDGSTKRRSVARDGGLIVRSHWSAGLRTPAWDRLWRAILSDIGPELSAVDVEPVERKGTPGQFRPMVSTCCDQFDTRSACGNAACPNRRLRRRQGAEAGDAE
jgi:hypothetical protein